MESNVSGVDSYLFRNIFGTDEMRKIMGDAACEEKMVLVESTLARVQGRIGIIPKSAADEIVRSCAPSHLGLDRAKLRRDTDLVGLPVWGLVRQLVSAAGAQESGRFVHWGLNTHDVMDLAQGVQMKQGLELIRLQLDQVRHCLVRLARRHRSTPMVARTHLQHALPTTFGCRVTIWLSALDRFAERLPQLAPRLLLAQVGGASGSLASLGATVADGETDAPGLQVLRAMADELGLVEPAMPWHAARDGLVEGVSFLGMLGGSLAKIAQDVILMSMPEIGEVSEPFVPHRGASSTMPHKNNPVLCEAILALSKKLRQNVALALEALPADFERAGLGAWHVEWLTVPESFTCCSAALQHAQELLDGLQVYPAAMRRNLDLSGGLVAAEHVVVAISESMGRAAAHDLVYDCCREAVERKTSLADILRSRPEIAVHMSPHRIDWYCDPANYLGLTLTMVDRVLAGRTRATSQVEE